MIKTIIGKLFGDDGQAKMLGLLLVLISFILGITSFIIDCTSNIGTLSHYDKLMEVIKPVIYTLLGLTGAGIITKTIVNGTSANGNNHTNANTTQPSTTDSGKSI